MIKFLRSIDIYGHPIGVLYKGNTAYNSLLGSVFTIITTVIVLSFSVANLAETISHTNQEETSRSIVIDINQLGRLNLIDLNFKLMFMVVLTTEHGTYYNH